MRKNVSIKSFNEEFAGFSSTLYDAVYILKGIVKLRGKEFLRDPIFGEIFGKFHFCEPFFLQ